MRLPLWVGWLLVAHFAVDALLQAVHGEWWRLVGDLGWCGGLLCFIATKESP